jgi:cyclophilin family peptidyl-prolyl cis-trans isomerase
MVAKGSAVKGQGVSRETLWHAETVTGRSVVLFHVKQQMTVIAMCCHVMACDRGAIEAAHDAARQSSAPAPTDPLQLVLDTDRRELTDATRSALESPDPALRRAAAVSLARLHDEAALPLLRRALRDTDPGVRGAASMGMGALEDDAPEGLVRDLASAVAAEEMPELRAQMIRDVGRLRSREGLASIEGELRAGEASERAGACLALAEYGLRAMPVPAAARARAAALLGAEQPLEVRLACAFALARSPRPADPDAAQGELVALGLATADPDPDVRLYAYRALGLHAGVALDGLARGTADPEWRVAVQAFRALASAAAAQEGGPAVYARALEPAARRSMEAGGSLHVLLAALEAAAPMARAQPLFTVAERLHRQLGVASENQTASRDRGLAHCAAAELVDRGRGWPSRVDACGLGQVSDAERAVRNAAILGAVEGAEPERARFLRRLFDGGAPSVQQAVMQAAPAVWHPDITALVLRALRGSDPGVLSTAAEALAAIARRAPTSARVPPPVAGDRAISALRAARANLADDDLETLTTWLDAVEATDARPLLPRVRALALHENRGVRARARTVLEHWELELPEGRIPPPSNPIAEGDLVPAASRPRVRIRTERGVVVIELRPDEAPVTVARFLGLVRAGFYDGLTFHRVVPAFVVQGGDPRGDGYGGPDWAQRCEDNRLRYVRGTVGMALAGRDTGGSQFFITHGAQPHLDGRYTAFGLVVEGMDAVDQIQAGDHLLDVSVSE